MEHNFKRFPELTTNQMLYYYMDSPHKQIFEDFDAKVTEVHDGDTITLNWEERDFEFPLRFLSIQAPELDEDGGIESRDWLSDLILGEEVRIEIDKTNRVGKYGRLLGKVMFNGLDINDLSLKLGMAQEF